MASFSIETPRSNGESKGSKGKTWMVLLASDDYIVGVLTLACSLRKVGSVFPLVSRRVLPARNLDMVSREASLASAGIKAGILNLITVPLDCAHHSRH